jgi:hypothetical protein
VIVYFPIYTARLVGAFKQREALRLITHAKINIRFMCDWRAGTSPPHSGCHQNLP